MTSGHRVRATLLRNFEHSDGATLSGGYSFKKIAFVKR